MLVSELIDRFLRWQEVDKRNAPATLKAYRQGLAWLRRSFADREWSDCPRDDVKAALDAANTNPKTGEPWANDTIRRNINSFQQLQIYAIDQEYVELPILRKKDLLKPPGTKRERIPSNDELQRILDAARPAVNLAFRAFAQSGMRPGELSQATIAMVEETEQGPAIVIHKHKTARKTRKPREIVLGAKLMALVQEGIGQRTEGPIWPDEKGGHWTPHRLSVAFRAIRDGLGLSKSLKLYSLRHLFATKAGRVLPVQKVALLMGHASVTTTQRYMHLNRRDALEAQDLV